MPIKNREMTLIKAPVQKQGADQNLTAQDIINIKTQLGIIEDAPQDGKTYGRKDGQWVEISSTPLPAPVITLNGANPQIIEIGTPYTELGATTDDGSTVVIDASAVDVNVVGNYNVTYNATNTEGTPAIEVIRQVQIVDTTAPAQMTITNIQ